MILLPEIVVPEGIAKLCKAFCGCGEPSLVWEVVRNELKRCSLNDKPKPPDDSNMGYWYFVQYILAHFDLTDHGSSIRYSWLTGSGQEVLDFLEEQGFDWQEGERDFVTADGVTVSSR